ncbi:MAG: hypothetical protein IT287_06580 [Bdellovibrionaceae bacterium]|nr:hypothetical protein [Pseudobdellovibrionaceae bacterium]
MKKNFALTAPNKKPDRVSEAVKAEVNKYLARERRKALPQGVDYWDFDCRVGADESSAKIIHVKELSKSIDEVVLQKVPSVYIEILAKPGYRAKKNSRERGEFDDER